MTDLPRKLKTALDETRILILGGQILLGFGLRGVFADGFGALPAQTRALHAAGLGLMVVVVGLLVAPEPYHRLVEAGDDSGAFQDYVTDIADLALLPFALALGIDVFIAVERVFGTPAAAGGGAATGAAALALWYGVPRARRRVVGQREREMTERQRHERPATPLHTKIEQLLTEARVVLPGAQALLGFQLSIVLTSAFAQLPGVSRAVHAASIGLVALAVILLMAPAAYHRIVYAGEETEDMHRTGSLLVTAATLPLGIGLAGDIYVVIAKMFGPAAGVAAGCGALAALLGLWYGLPLAALWRGRGASKAQGQSG